MSLNQKTLSKTPNKVQSEINQDIAVTSDLIKVVKNVQEKVNMAKFREYELAHASNKIFKPVTDPLQNISNSLNLLRKSQSQPIQQTSLVTDFDHPLPTTHPATAALKTPIERQRESGLDKNVTVRNQKKKKEPKRRHSLDETIDARDLTLLENGIPVRRHINVSPISPKTLQDNPAASVIERRPPATIPVTEKKTRLSGDYLPQITLDDLQFGDNDEDENPLLAATKKASLESTQIEDDSIEEFQSKPGVLLTTRLGLSEVNSTVPGLHLVLSGTETPVIVNEKSQTLKISGKKYAYTPDVWHLLTQDKIPLEEIKQIKSAEREMFFTILNDNMNLYLVPSNIKNTTKYQHIIKPFLSTSRFRTASPVHKDGKGLQLKTLLKKNKYLNNLELKKVVNTSPNYIYWNNVSELIQRLRKLIASKSAGNTSAEEENEIISIIEELREEKIVA